MTWERMSEIVQVVLAPASFIAGIVPILDYKRKLNQRYDQQPPHVSQGPDDVSRSASSPAHRSFVPKPFPRSYIPLLIVACLWIVATVPIAFIHDPIVLAVGSWIALGPILVAIAFRWLHIADTSLLLKRPTRKAFDRRTERFMPYYTVYTPLRLVGESLLLALVYGGVCAVLGIVAAWSWSLASESIDLVSVARASFVIGAVAIPLVFALVKDQVLSKWAP